MMMKTLPFIPSATLLLLINVFVISRSGETFSDSFARHKMFPLSAAAYSTRPQACLSRALPGSQLVGQTTVRCDFINDTCDAYVAVSVADQAVIVSFRGTTGSEQLILEIVESATRKVSFAAGGHVSEYFFNGFNDLWKAGLGASLTRTIHAFPSYQLWVTGHSLGGAMASLCAAYIVHAQIVSVEQVRVVTFGQPRTGDPVYAQSFMDMLPSSVFRVTHRFDMVPHAPPIWLGYKHHTTEVFYPNDMAEGAAFKVCARQEDPNCSLSLFNVSTPDHVFYYGHQVVNYGLGGCQ